MNSDTRLAQWCDQVRAETGKSRSDIARELGIRIPHFSNLCAGRGKASLALALRIRELSKGFVEPHHLPNGGSNGEGE
jgi:hypothetical protein